MSMSVNDGVIAQAKMFRMEFIRLQEEKASQQALHVASKKEAELQEAELQKEMRVVSGLREKLAVAETNKENDFARTRQLSTTEDNLRRALAHAEDQCKHGKETSSIGAEPLDLAGWAKCSRETLRTSLRALRRAQAQHKPVVCDRVGTLVAERTSLTARFERISEILIAAPHGDLKALFSPTRRAPI
ncbi:hypothetical protein T484DRAFT_1742054 [Baffinella frigidus]|nr:hypothetical protein T484DRAFT_1742054 [Cryptophyta sp. CCMP2293]